jgi:hypothetical protein
MQAVWLVARDRRIDCEITDLKLLAAAPVAVADCKNRRRDTIIL